MINSIFSLGVGILSGYVYALAFVTQQKRVFLSPFNVSRVSFLLVSMMSTILRIIILAGGFYMLIACNNIQSLTFITSFISTWWLTLIFGPSRQAPSSPAS